MGRKRTQQIASISESSDYSDEGEGSRHRKVLAMVEIALPSHDRHQLHGDGGTFLDRECALGEESEPD